MSNAKTLNNSKRRAYHRDISATWWQKSTFYRFYMLRESTAIPALWFSILLLAGLLCLNKGIDRWEEFVAFLRYPLVMLLNFIALLAALLHSKTWFELAPKAVIIIVKSQKLGFTPMVAVLWAIAAIVTLAILLIALF